MITEPTSLPSGLASPSCCLSSFLDRVILGDNCETLAAMPAESVDLVVTSPPYDDLRTYGGHSWDFYGVAWLLKRVIKPGGVIVWVVGDATVNGSETGSSMMQALHFRAIGLNVHDTMIYKQAGTGAKGSNQAYWQAWEYCFVMSKGKPAVVNRLKKPRKETSGPPGSRVAANGTRKEICRAEAGDESIRDNVWEYSVGAANDDDATGHPAAFPESLAKDHIFSWSNPGDVVLDPFAGSGTTLKAAKELGRRFVGIEINAKYVEICQRRIAQEVLNLFPDNDKLTDGEHKTL